MNYCTIKIENLIILQIDKFHSEFKISEILQYDSGHSKYYFKDIVLFSIPSFEYFKRTMKNITKMHIFDKFFFVLIAFLESKK